MLTAHSIKRTLKRGLQHTAARLGRHTRDTKVPQLLILMYHRILPLEDARARLEEPGMLLSPTSFAQHLKALSDYFEFITLSHFVRL